jgi:hypothetical protein
MEKYALTEGRLYAYREKTSPGTLFLKVKLIEKVAGRPTSKSVSRKGPIPGLRSTS